MNDLNDGHDEILDYGPTTEEQVRNYLAKLRDRIGDTLSMLRSKEFKELRKRLEIIEGEELAANILINSIRSL